MSIDPIVISFIKHGIGMDPKFNLKIYGNGKVEYSGIGNVKVKGIVISSVSKEKIILLFKKLKEENFFSLKEIYMDEKNSNKSYSEISISIPGEDGKVLKKSVKYYNNGKTIPKNLLNIEKKIYEIIGLNKWIKYPTKEKNDKTKNHYQIKKINIKNKKIILLLITLSIILVFFVTIFSGIINLSFSGNQTDDQLKIINLNTASSIQGFRNFDQKYYFSPGDRIYIYFEYEGVEIKDNNCDIKVDVVVTKSSETYFQKSYKQYTLNDYFELNLTSQKNWSIGSEFEISINLYDNINKKDVESKTNFILLEDTMDSPKIVELEPASSIRGYKDYDSEHVFQINETIFIYEEYTNITIIDNSICNLSLELIVTKNDIIIYQKNIEKSIILNNAHEWYFTPDGNWTSGLYYVRANLIDNVTNKNASKLTFFTLI